MNEITEGNVAELLAAIDHARLAHAVVERGANLPDGFVRKAKAGKNRHMRAAPSWARLRRWLVENGAVSPAPGRLEDDPKPTSLPADTTDDVSRLEEAIEGIRTFRRLRQVTQRLAALTAAGKIKPAQADRTLAALKELKVSMRLEREERGMDAIAALEILTPQEEQALAEWRAKNVGVPLQPGGYVLPPVVDALGSFTVSEDGNDEASS